MVPSAWSWSTTKRFLYLFYYLDSPPEVVVSFPADDIQDKSFKVKFETKNINNKAYFQIDAPSLIGQMDMNSDWMRLI